MKTPNKYLFLLLLILAAALLLADDQSDPLWLKARQIAQQNEFWAPGKLEQNSFQKNGKGKVKSQESVIVNYQQNEVELETVFVSASRDGEPVGIDDKRVQSVLNEEVIKEGSLFHNFQGKDLIVTRTDAERTIDGNLCVGFDYSFIKPDDEGKDFKSWGTVWLENKKGIPLLNEMNITPPKKVVKYMKTTSYYNNSETEWYLQKADMTFKISLVIKTIIIDVKREYSDYWQYIVPERN